MAALTTAQPGVLSQLQNYRSAGLSDFLMNAGVGLMSGQNLGQSVAMGAQGYVQGRSQREKDAMRQRELDRQAAMDERRENRADKQFTAGQDQFQQTFDQNGQRIAQAGEQDAWARQNAVDQRDFMGEQGNLDRNSQAALERMRGNRALEAARISAGSGWTTERVPMADGTSAILRFNERTGERHIEPIEGSSAGVSLQTAEAYQNEKYETGMAQGASAALNTAENLRNVERIVKENPGLAGPRAIAGLRRWAGNILGWDESRFTQEMSQGTAQAALDKVLTDMVNQGTITESERAGARAAVFDPEKYDGKTAEVLIPKLIAQAEHKAKVYDDYLNVNPMKREGSRGFEFTSRYNSYRKNGGVVAPPQTSGTNKTSTGVEWSINE